MYPVGDEVLRALALLSRDNAAEQPRSDPTVVGMPEIVGCAAVSERIPVPCAISWTARSTVTPSMGHLRDGAVAAVDARSVQYHRRCSSPWGRMLTVDDGGGTHRVLGQRLRVGLPGRLGGGPRAGNHDRYLASELPDLVGVVEEALRVHAQEDHDRGLDGSGGVGDRPDRAVGAEVGDPPAAAA